MALEASSIEKRKEAEQKFKTSIHAITTERPELLQDDVFGCWFRHHLINTLGWSHGDVQSLETTAKK